MEVRLGERRRERRWEKREGSRSTRAAAPSAPSSSVHEGSVRLVVSKQRPPTLTRTLCASLSISITLSLSLWRSRSLIAYREKTRGEQSPKPTVQTPESDLHTLGEKTRGHKSPNHKAHSPESSPPLLFVNYKYWPAYIVRSHSFFKIYKCTRSNVSIKQLLSPYRLH
jgi:hypothetical protein